MQDLKISPPEVELWKVLSSRKCASQGASEGFYMQLGGGRSWPEISEGSKRKVKRKPTSSHPPPKISAVPGTVSADVWIRVLDF